jgi:RNA polymerase sigma factor (sigma-70 family)
LELQTGATLSTLVARCASAPAAAADWPLLVDRLTPSLRGAVVGTMTLCRVPRRRELIDDLTQEVWCRLLAGDRRALRDYRGASDGEATTYLRRIAATIVFDRLRSEAAGKRLPERLLVADAGEALGGKLADRRGCPERRLLARERARELAQLCAELVGKPRRAERLAIARLAIVEGRSSREIAVRVGRPWSEGRINSFLFRLRRRLARHGVVLAPRARGIMA